MAEVVTGIVVVTVVYYLTFVVAVWYFQVRRAGPRVQTLFFRWAVGWLVSAVVVAGWAASGIAVITSAGVFWQGVWAGASAVLWAGSAVGLVWLIRAGRRAMSAARVADAAGLG